MNDLTLLIPVKNEVESLKVFLKDLKPYNYKKLFVIDINDNNDYKNIFKDYRDCKFLKSTKAGYGSALIEGINYIQTKYFCIINADGSMDPKELQNMILFSKNFSFVFTSRYLKDGGSDDDTFITYIGNRMFSFLGKLLFKLNISDILYTYILGDTKLAKSLNLENYDFRICVEIPIKIHKKKYSYKDISSYEKSRIGGKKKVNAFKDGLLILTEILRLYFK